MAQLNIEHKVLGSSFTHDEVNAMVAAINAKGDGARIAKNVNNIITGYVLNHGWGTMLAKTADQYVIEVRAYDAGGAPCGGFTITKSTLDVAIVNITPGASPHTGVLIFDLTLIA